MQMAVLDDFFPLPMSGFRFEEFRCYLDALPNVTVHSTCGAVAHHGRDNRSVDELIAAHVAAYPEHARRVLPMQHGFLPEADAYYAIFLNNIIPYVDAIESAGKLFAFTLYPGGGLRIADAVSDEKLRRVCNSPSL